MENITLQKPSSCKSAKFKIVFTGGGTGGHVYPNVALFDEFARRGFDLAYVGAKGDVLEKRLATQRSVRYYGVQTIKLVRSLSPSATKNNVMIPLTLSRAVKECADILKNEKPDCVFSKGGFVSLPVVLAAKKLRIPVVAHESDLTLGLANKIAKAKGATVLKANPHSTFDGIFTGLPLREELFWADKTKAQKTLGITNPRNKKVLLVLGGSSGARAINEAVRENLKELTNRYIVVHVTGKDKQTEKMRADDYYCVEYAHDVEKYYALSDVVLSRAGATAVFEISALKKRAVFVPLPKGVSRGDQIFNADLAKEYGATILTQDDDFSSKLVPAIERAEKNPPMKRIAIDANGKIADVVCDIVGACKNKKP